MNYEVQILIKNSIRHIQDGRLDQARILLTKARNLERANSEVIRLLSVVAALGYDFNNALALVDESIELAPRNGIAHSNRGNILKELFRYEEAIIALDRAISLLPDYAEAYNNKGNVFQELHRYDEALFWYDKAIILQPNYAEAYSNKGNALSLLRRHQEAMECYNKATTINPQYADAYWHKALSQLLVGDFQNGWQNYESRWFKESPVQYRFNEIPRLSDPEKIDGKNILIWSEQGLGDSIQFSRYIELLYLKGGKITFLVPPSLLRIFEPLKSFCQLTGTVEKQTNYDFHSPLLSLPLVFSTDINSIPVKVPYLFPESKKIQLMLSRMSPSQRFKVGVIWNGGFRVDAPMLWSVNKRRNIELDQIALLRDVENVDFYSLQKGDPAESELFARKDELWPRLINCAQWLDDFSDTAALMANLDLIISVDTSSAHLAGALGKPVWILNRYDSCWRWLHGRTDSPWYPTATLYQQKEPGDWNHVISRVKQDLSAIVKKVH